MLGCASIRTGPDRSIIFIDAGDDTTGMLQSVYAGIREFPANMNELLRNPRTLILFLAGVAVIIYVSTDAMMAYFFAPAVLAMGLLAYFVFLWHKQGFKLDLIRKVVTSLSCSIIIGASFYGYAVSYVNDIDMARFPSELSAAKEWSRARFLDDSELQAYNLLRVEVRGYMYNDLDPVRAPYPGAIWLVTVKTVFIPSQEMLEQQVTKLIENLKQDGLAIDKTTKTTGSETVKSGHDARYVDYQAVLGMTTGGAFYNTATGAKVKIRAEWWPCQDHGTAIIVVGAAQWGNTQSQSRIQNVLIGRQVDDMTTYENVLRLIYATHCA